MKNWLIKNGGVLLWLYGIAALSLFFYSYTQVDLGLVITRIPWLYAIEKSFQYVGYFNRPLSTFLFCLLVLVFLGLYVITWRLSLQNKISSRSIWFMVGIVTVVLTFSYNAFSYDLFNYIFDAKIVTHYGQNPYLHKALDFPTDPMLGFMHWTQRTYPYGPLWLGLTVPLSFVGGNIFTITFFLFKILMSASYLGTIYFLYKILQKLYPQNAIEGVVLFALNPLVIFESLVSSHNDIVMFFFAMWAIYLLVMKRYTWAFALLFISVLIKFATLALLPLFILMFLHRKKLQTEHWQKFFDASMGMMLLALFLVTNRTSFQPWYLLYLLPFLPFVTAKILQKKVVLLTFFSLLLYIPYLLWGNWNSSWYTVPEGIFYWLTVLGGIYGGISLVRIML